MPFLRDQILSSSCNSYFSTFKPVSKISSNSNLRPISPTQKSPRLNNHHYAYNLTPPPFINLNSTIFHEKSFKNSPTSISKNLNTDPSSSEKCATNSCFNNLMNIPYPTTPFPINRINRNHKLRITLILNYKIL